MQLGDCRRVVFDRLGFFRSGEWPLTPTRRTALWLCIPYERCRAGEDARQRIIIPRRNGIELVVVAAGATDGQTEKGARRHVDLFVHDVHLQLGFARLEKELRSQHNEPRRRELVVALLLVVAGKQVAGELLANEPGERLVLVECAHDVIAIPPRIFIRQIDFQPVRVGIAGHVEPVPAPTLAKLRPREQPIHDFGKSVVGIVGQKGFDLFRFGRQPGQVERGAPNQCAFISRRARFELVLFQLGQNETVDRIAWPVFLFDSREREVARWQESPMPRTRNAERGTRNRRPARIGGAHANPHFQIANLWRRQNFLWRHLQLAVGVAHRMDESALFRVARDDYRSRFTAFHPTVA